MEKDSSEKSTTAEIPRFSVNHMDMSANPFVDFYRYVCGNWLVTHPIPEDKTRWGAFNELMERNTYILWKILERCASANKDHESQLERFLGDFYISVMDTESIEKKKFAPIHHLIKMIEDADSKKKINQVLAHLHSVGIPCFFDYYAEADEKNSSIYAFHFYQGGLSLPDREYYTHESFAVLRKEYEAHIARMFKLLYTGLCNIERYSNTVLDIETKLAKSSRPRADLRDTEKNYNRSDSDSLPGMYNNIDLAYYLRTVGVPEVPYVIIGQPEFFEALDSLVASESIDNLKIYLIWKVINFSAPFLHSEVDEEHFDFFNRKLLGQKEQEPRWKRAVRIIDMLVGESLGKIYVDEQFGDEARKRISTMIEDIKMVFRRRLETVPWMSDSTRQRAIEKFDKFRTKIGYPKKFRDYSSVKVVRDDFFGNVTRAMVFEIKRQIGRVGSPVDREEWLMTPPTVNAYFNPTENEIVFPAGILQPPFFDVELDDPVNYGGIGTVISHEITHGFDDQGRRFDENGNLKEWWTADDEKAFMERAKKVVELYSLQEVLPGVHVNGELTLGENIADFGGVSIAFEALERHLKENPLNRKNIDGLTPEQRFFISYGQIWRSNVREQEAKRLATIDPHSPEKFRATLPAVNHEAFESTFESLIPDKYENSKEKIKVW